MRAGSRWALVLSLLCGALLGVLPGAWAGDKVTATVETWQAAGIDGRAWDQTYPDARTMDAANRAVLVRFPGAAEQIAAKLAEGFAIEKAEVTLAYEGYELNPEGYICRYGLGEERWKGNPPRWHVVGWALRRPWTADPHLGPTFNAYINGAGYWEKYGAADEGADRFAQRFGPAELSDANPKARLDVTPLLTDADYGESLGQRLRLLEESGLLLKKLETHDMRYDDWWGSYEWAVPTGGHGLSFSGAKLTVTFAPGEGAAAQSLPPATDIAALAQRLKADGSGGSPTAVMPTAQEIRDLARQHGFTRPTWMADWQWERVQELRTLGGGEISLWSSQLESADPVQYQRLMGNILSTAPRYWKGWGIQDDLLLWYRYRDMLPAPVRDHVRAYWDAWLMPDVPTERFFHAQSRLNQTYWEQTQDWRGRKSFFRAGYNYVISTMNFNHTAAMGALLGGSIINSQRAMADGRHGLEYLPLRLWAWYDGTTQESIDHYYYAITLSGQKMFADFGPTRLDRMMGQSILAKSVEELMSSYHPGLRRFINTSGRTGIGYLFVMQDGLQHIIHTLSRSGALHDIGNPDTSGMPALTHDAPPGRIALQTVSGPWAPPWASYMVDEKPIPYQMTVAQKEWGHFAKTPLWRRCYLGNHYGVASVDVARYGSVPLMAQWRRAPEQADNVQDIGTLLARFTVNTPNLVVTHGGSGLMQGGNMVSVHHKNKLVMLTSPLARLDGHAPEKVNSLQTTIGLFTFQETPTWELYVDNQRWSELPVRAKAGQRITLKDGVTYLGLIPLPATDLGRTEEVLISGDGAPGELQGGGKARPALLIQSCNYRSDTPLSQAQADPEKVDLAYGGFVIELGDATEYGDFAAFQRHMDATRLETRWDAASGVLHVGYRSGEDAMEFGFRPEYQVYADRGVPTDQCFPYRRVNGTWPYLPQGLDRDATLTQQGRCGRLEKNGAVLRCERGRMAYLQTEPITGTYAGFNPLPDPTLWSLSVPGGLTVAADGRVGLLRAVISPGQNRLWVDYALKEEQRAPDMARALLVLGAREAPSVEFNGAPCSGSLGTIKLDGQTAYVVSLAGVLDAQELQAIPERCRRAQEVLALHGSDDFQPLFVHDWYVVGPFPHADFSRVLWTGELAQYPPEQEVDLSAAYTGMERAEDGTEAPVQVRWKRLLKPGEAALGPGPVVLADHFTPNKLAIAYAYTTIASDRDREVTLYTGSDQCLAVWLNGQQVLSRVVYRAASPSQDRVTVRLKKGVNTVLLKSAAGHEGWSFYFGLGDEYGLPLSDGLSFGFGER